MAIREKIFLWAENEPHLAMLPIICFILGILIYFNLPIEPSAVWITGGFVFVGACLCFATGKIKKFLLSMPLMLIAGIGVCLLHTAFVQTRTLTTPLENVRVYGTVYAVEKRTNAVYIDLKIEKITKKDFNGAEMIALKSKHLPQRVRLTTQEENIIKGDKLSGFARQLIPPQLPITPFGTNEARKLWFEGIGATGFISDVKILSAPQRPLYQKSLINKIRNNLQATIFETLSFENAGVAAALILGDSHLVSTSSRLLYRDLGIAHILAVSGFHIGLITFFIFAFIRLLLNIILPQLSPVMAKRVSLVMAALVGGFYVFISGVHPPAIRSFIMVSACLIALFFDKRAISIRNLFFAAFLILCYKPVLLMDLGFQLSFISVLCLIGVCGQIKKYFYAKSLVKKITIGLALMLIFNFLVSVATAPFVLYTFHQVPLYGVIGNLLLSSLFAFAIIPLSFLSLATAFIAPVSITLLKGVDLLLSLVRSIGMPITSWPYASVYVPYFHAFGLVLWAIGMTGVALFQTKIRYVFCLFFLIAPLSFVNIEKPTAMIGAGGKFIGFRQSDTYFETESYYYKKLHQAWITYHGLNPEKEHILPLKSTNSPLIALSEKTCRNALVYMNTKNKPSACPRQLFPFQINRWQTVLIYNTPHSPTYRPACETDTKRPWGFYCPTFSYFVPE